MAHVAVDPAILYWGTPVAILSTLNADGTTNLAAMSSAWWLGNRCVLGLAGGSQTPTNIRREGSVVVNLPGPDQIDAINALASTTGTEAVPGDKVDRGYRYVPDKWAVSGLTPLPSDLIPPLRVAECPVQMECTLVACHKLMADLAPGRLLALEVTVRRVHVRPHLLLAGHTNRINPDALRLCFMSFQHLYALHPHKLGPSDLARVDEELYRLPPGSTGTVPETERQEVDAERQEEEARADTSTSTGTDATEGVGIGDERA